MSAACCCRARKLVVIAILLPCLPCCTLIAAVGLHPDCRLFLQLVGRVVAGWWRGRHSAWHCRPTAGPTAGTWQAAPDLRCVPPGGVLILPSPRSLLAAKANIVSTVVRVLMPQLITTNLARCKRLVDLLEDAARTSGSRQGRGLRQAVAEAQAEIRRLMRQCVPGAAQMLAAFTSEREACMAGVGNEM